MELDHLAFSPGVDLRALLKREFSRRQRINKKYSLRAFAKYLGLSHAALSEMLAGKRRISVQNVRRIGGALGWSERDLDKALRSVEKDPLNFSQLSDEQVETLSEWYYNVILELFLLENFDQSTAWIAKATGLSEGQVHAALLELEEAGQIRRTRSGEWKVVNHMTTTLGNVRSKAAIHKLQKQFLQRQAAALDHAPVEEQSMMGLTIPMDPADLPEARKIIYRCIKDLSRLLNRKGVRRSEVYRLQLGLFPLTRARGLK